MTKNSFLFFQLQEIFSNCINQWKKIAHLKKEEVCDTQGHKSDSQQSKSLFIPSLNKIVIYEDSSYLFFLFFMAATLISHLI